MTVRTGYNNLRIFIYESFSLTARYDTDDDLLNATITDISTYFPGGRFGTCRIFIPRDVTRAIPWTGGDRIEIKNALDVVWEGEISNILYTVGRNAEQGIQLICSGFWGTLMEGRTWNKIWADVRVSAEVWREQSDASGAEMATVDRENRLRFTPKNEEWASNQTFKVRYTMPTGETIKRVQTTRTLEESAETTPRVVWHLDDPGGTPAWTDMTNAYDESAGTGVARTLTSDDYLYIACPYPYVTGIKFDLGASLNNNVASLDVQYFGQADDGVGAWISYSTISDGTDSGGAPFAQDGSISLGEPTEIGRVTTGDPDNQVSGYYIRISPSANLDAVTFNEIYIAMAQQWEFKLYDQVGTTTIWTLTTDTSDDIDDSTLGTPRQHLDLEYKSKTNRQRPPDRDLMYAEVKAVKVYSETGNINVYEIAKDVRAEVSDLNSDENNIGSNTFSLVPFMTNGPETYATILMRAASFGDASYNSWEAHLLPSEDAATPDGKPVLALEQYPVLTDYDYAIRIDEPNVIPPLSIARNFADIANWISVTYRNPENNRKVLVTPDDDANLKDTTSITAYGERHLNRPLNAGTATSTMAKNLARRVLAAKKDPGFYMRGPIRVVGYIRAKNGEHVPAANIRAGERIKIENFLDDLAGETGAGLTFIITGTKYDDQKETCSITTGVPDVLAAFLAQQTFMSDWLIRDRDKPHDHLDNGAVASV